MCVCRFSIIIPARNDAVALARTVDHLVRLDGIDDAEIIVAACGDREGTSRAAGRRARLLWPSDSTRAGLMNAGASAASGEILFFLHADSAPPLNALRLMESALADGRVVGGAFEHRFTERDWRLGIISGMNRLRYRFTRNYYGDQGIFVRTVIFRQLGGYRPLRLLEDLDLTRRLKRLGRSVVIPVALETSGRRFLVRGPLRTLAFSTWLLLRYTLGLDTERYAERWRGPADGVPGSSWGSRRLRQAEKARAVPTRTEVP